MVAASAPPLTLTLKPSRRLVLCTSVCYAAAGLAAIANPLVWWLRTLMLVAVMAGAWLVWRRYLLQPIPTRLRLRWWNAPRVFQLRISEIDEWTLWTTAGEEIPVDLLAGSIVVSWLIVLHFRDRSGRFRAVSVLPDSLEPDGFRRLMVRLRVSNWL